MRNAEEIEREIVLLQQKLDARGERIKHELNPILAFGMAFDPRNGDASKGFENIESITRSYPISTVFLLGSVAAIALQRLGYVDEGRVRLKLASAADKGETIMTSTKDNVHNLSEKAKQKVQETRESLNETYAHTKEALQDGAARMRRRSRRAYRQSSDFARENPAALGLMAVAIGAAAASLYMMRRPSRSDYGDYDGDLDYEGDTRIYRSASHQTPRKGTYSGSSYDTDNLSPNEQSSGKVIL